MPHTHHPCTRTCSLETPPGSLLCGEPTTLSQPGREVWILLIPLPRKVQTHPLYFYGDMHAAAAQSISRRSWRSWQSVFRLYTGERFYGLGLCTFDRKCNSCAPALRTLVPARHGNLASNVPTCTVGWGGGKLSVSVGKSGNVGKSYTVEKSTFQRQLGI